MRNLGWILRLAVGVAAIVGALWLFHYAIEVAPDPSDRHGDAIDGLDGLGTCFSLVSGAGGLLLLVFGGWLTLPAIRGSGAGARVRR